MTSGVTPVTGKMMEEWMRKSWKASSIGTPSARGEISESSSTYSIPAFASLRGEVDGFSRSTSTLTEEVDFESDYQRSWRRIRSESDLSMGGGIAASGDNTPDDGKIHTFELEK